MDTESRFAHLLQPIRELARNWDVDVATELNDYLEELDGMCITFDDGKTQMNFVEAAMLIQGSTCIYSKKVELLHHLVYQTLEYINKKNEKEKEAAAAAAAQQDAAAAEDEHEADDVAVFCPLDTDVSQDAISGGETEVCVAPLPPASLILPDSREKNKLPLISVKGDILCSQKDFRINLLMDGDEDMVRLRQLSASFPRFMLDSVLYAEDSPLHRDEDAGAAAAVEDDGGGAAEDFCPPEDTCPPEDGLMEVEEHVDRHQAPSEGRAVRDRRQVDAHKPARTEETPAVSAWALHDPYGVLGEARPFRPGKCYRVPDGLDDGGKRKRRRAAALQDFSSWFRGTYEPPQHKMKNGPAFTELNYIYLSTMKERLRSRRRICRRAGVNVSEEELRRSFLLPEGAEPQPQGEEPEGGVSPLLDGDSDDDLEPFPDDLPDEFVGGADVQLPGAQTVDELNYEDLVKLRVEQLVGTCRSFVRETALSRRIRDWQDFLRPALEQQDLRPVFDIHDYGDRIAAALSAVGQRRRFAAIVSGMEDYEACKYLLASLQLANDGTVAVDSVAPGGGGAALEDSVDSMGLTLLSTLRAADRFRTLTASS